MEWFLPVLVQNERERTGHWLFVTGCCLWVFQGGRKSKGAGRRTKENRHSGHMRKDWRGKTHGPRPAVVKEREWLSCDSVKAWGRRKREGRGREGKGRGQSMLLLLPSSPPFLRRYIGPDWIHPPKSSSLAGPIDVQNTVAAAI